MFLFFFIENYDIVSLFTYTFAVTLVSRRSRREMMLFRTELLRRQRACNRSVENSPWILRLNRIVGRLIIDRARPRDLLSKECDADIFLDDALVARNLLTPHMTPTVYTCCQVDIINGPSYFCSQNIYISFSSNF